MLSLPLQPVSGATDDHEAALSVNEVPARISAALVV